MSRYTGFVHKPTKMKKGTPIIVGMSGGVDSSVALVLLKKQGFQPIGVSLKYDIWQDEENELKENVCCSDESFEIARHVCESLDCEYHILDTSKEFKEKVVGYFKDELREKRTPNPCVICNRVLKFFALLDFADKHNVEYVATGHFARIENGKLLKGKDHKKDQTYTLSFLKREWLSRILLPLGSYTKEEIFALAEEAGFSFYKKRKQSQDFCFVSEKAFKKFLEKEIGIEKGDIINAEGETIGKHPGLHFYTIGQRKGIDAPNGPNYVIGMERNRNKLVISNDGESKYLYKSEISLSPFNFLIPQPKEILQVEAKIRYQQDLAKATLYPEKNGKLKLIFDVPVRAVTSGQYAVFYQGDVCLGSGRII